MSNCCLDRLTICLPLSICLFSWLVYLFEVFVLIVHFKFVRASIFSFFFLFVKLFSFFVRWFVCIFSVCSLVQVFVFARSFVGSFIFCLCIVLLVCLFVPVSRSCCLYNSFLFWVSRCTGTLPWCFIPPGLLACWFIDDSHICLFVCCPLTHLFVIFRKFIFFYFKLLALTSFRDPVLKSERYSLDRYFQNTSILIP